MNDIVNNNVFPITGLLGRKQEVSSEPVLETKAADALEENVIDITGLRKEDLLVDMFNAVFYQLGGYSKQDMNLEHGNGQKSASYKEACKLVEAKQAIIRHNGRTIVDLNSDQLDITEFSEICGRGKALKIINTYRPGEMH